MKKNKWWDNIFADPADGLIMPDQLTEIEKQDLMKKISTEIVKRQLTLPVIIFLESIRPLSYIGSQAMVFFNPLVQIVFPTKMYGQLQLFFEDRENMEKLIQAIEAEDERFNQELKEEKIRDKEKKAKLIGRGHSKNQGHLTFRNRLASWFKRRKNEAKRTDNNDSCD